MTTRLGENVVTRFVLPRLAVSVNQDEHPVGASPWPRIDGRIEGFVIALATTVDPIGRPNASLQLPG